MNAPLAIGQLLPELDHRHLDHLEEEAIFVLREVAASFERPALLFSGGKDSCVVLRLAEKAFKQRVAGNTFSGRLPFVVDGNTRGWLAAIGRMQAAGAKVVVPGHGEASENVAADLALTGGYLRFLRSELGRAVEEMIPFDEAYERIDWSDYANLPTFEAANRRNAYTVYLELEAEALGSAGGG